MKTHRAFLLIEMLMAISLLALFAVVGVKLLTSTITIARTSAAEHNALLRQERMMDQIRRDVWSVDAIVISDDGSKAQLHQPHGDTIEWRNGVEAGLERVMTARDVETQVQSWNDVEAVEFAAEGPVLVLRQARKELPPSEVRLPSQLMMLKEAPR